MGTMRDMFVTSGARYTGSHCCKELYYWGYNLVVPGNLVYGHKTNVMWGDFIQGSVSDTKLLKEIFRKYNIQAVMPFAAYAYVGESVTDPQKYYQNNAQGTISLLEQTLNYNVGYFIFSSSCAVYGIPCKIPIDEGHPRRSISPCGRLKHMIEEILADYIKAYPFEFMSLRYFNAAGADPEGELGKKHDPETHIIPLILDVAKGLTASIQLYGNDYDVVGRRPCDPPVLIASNDKRRLLGWNPAYTNFEDIISMAWNWHKNFL
jgi:UDP-glucose 4-epimerase